MDRRWRNYVRRPANDGAIFRFFLILAAFRSKDKTVFPAG